MTDTLSPSLRVLNTHGQLVAAGGGVAIITSYGGTRDSFVDGWEIYVVEANGKARPTDEDAAWYHYGRKHVSMRTVGNFHERRREALEKAKAWVAIQLGEDGPWSRNAIGDFVPSRVQKQFPIKREKRISR